MNPNGDLDAAAKHLVDALSRLAIDVLIAWLTHKASGAVKQILAELIGGIANGGALQRDCAAAEPFVA